MIKYKKIIKIWQKKILNKPKSSLKAFNKRFLNIVTYLLYFIKPVCKLIMKDKHISQNYKIRWIVTADH